MSLINEALKKAQRQRHGDASAAAGQPDAEGRVAKRSQPKSATSMLLLVAGGVVLVALSIVATALWLTRPSTPAVAAAKPATPAAKSPASDAGKAPVVVVPVIHPPAAATATAPAPSAATASAPASMPQSPAKSDGGEAAAATTGTATAAAQPPPAVAPSNEAKTASATTSPPKPEEPAAPPTPDERIHKYVEALRVTGIRSSGTESKVLMNDRVYRVNDIVDRALGVRLTQVSPDSLTFTDANGATYVKYF